jgi:hypothetical protein
MKTCNFITNKTQRKFHDLFGVDFKLVSETTLPLIVKVIIQNYMLICNK